MTHEKFKGARLRTVLSRGISALQRKIASLLKSNKIDERPWHKFYDAGVPCNIEIPTHPLTKFFKDAVRAHPEGTAIVYFGRKIKFKSFDRLVKRFAHGLQKLNVKKGDRIAIILPNIPQYMIVHWAVLSLGAIIVPINPLYSEREILYQIKNSQARIVVVLDRLYSRVKKVRDTNLRQVIITSLETFMPNVLTLLFQIRKRFEKLEKIRESNQVIPFTRVLSKTEFDQEVSVKADDPAVLIYTGGVTGKPKAAVLTHKNIVANALMARSWINDFNEGGEIILAALPLIHSYGMTACHHLGIIGKSTLLLYPRFNAKKILKSIGKNKVTVFAGVPTMFYAINQELKIKKYDLSTIKFCISGGAPLPLSVKEEFERLGKCMLVEGYGLTEASPITHCNPIHGLHKKGSIGVPWPSTDAKITSFQDGSEVASGEKGELQVRGPQVMHKYWKNDSETKNVLSPDGWLKTGDIAQMDRDGYFYVIDRKKDVIFSGGFNVYPSEVEQVLASHPCIREASVIGVFDKYLGQKVKAFIIKQGDSELTPEEIVNFCRDKLAKFKLPQEIEFRTEFPRNFLGKVLKRELEPQHSFTY